MAAVLLLAAVGGTAWAAEGGAGSPAAPPAVFGDGGWVRDGDALVPQGADRSPDLGGEAGGVGGAGTSRDGAPRAAALAPEPAVTIPAEPATPGTDPDGDPGGGSGADADSEADADGDARIEALCAQLTAAADRHAVPHDFFVRLIWKESRFNANAVSPVGARGIAQFMPSTARARGLGDPFDPDEALPASAHFLRDLKNQFGVWGLAAAGYNAGPNRVLAYLAGRSGLPYETLDFVYAITGREADYWKLRARRLKVARASPPAAPRPLPLRTEPAAPAGLAPAVAAAKSATPTIVPPITAAAPSGHPDAGGGATVEGDRVKMVVHRPMVTDGPPDDLGPSPVPGIVVHRPSRAGRPPHASPADAAAVTAAVPRTRPEIETRPVDCARLVVALGRARTSPRPAFGGGAGGGWSPWGAQVAGHPQRAIALRQFGRHRTRLPGDLQSPSVVVRRFPARGRLPIHAVQFGAASRSEAQATCARVARALVPCVVVKNR